MLKLLLNSHNEPTQFTFGFLMLFVVLVFGGLTIGLSGFFNENNKIQLVGKLMTAVGMGCFLGCFAIFGIYLIVTGIS